MMNAMNYRNALVSAWVKNGFSKTSLKVGSGYTVTVSPCDINNYQELMAHQKRLETDPHPYFGYFLVDSYELPWLGDSDLMKVCQQFADYDKLIAENDSEKEKLRRLRTHILNSQSYDEAMEMFDSYSDWHKDLYGHRPHEDFELNEHFRTLKKKGAA